MPYVHTDSPDDTTKWFVERLSEQEAAHDGAALRRWARTVLGALPGGPVELVATSVEGCALAAVVAAQREAAPTRWRRLVLGRDERSSTDFAIVVVEPMRLGAGLHQAIAEALPDALVMSGFASERFAAAA
jgi:hypothetical protein